MESVVGGEIHLEPVFYSLNSAKPSTYMTIHAHRQIILRAGEWEVECLCLNSILSQLILSKHDPSVVVRRHAEWSRISDACEAPCLEKTKSTNDNARDCYWEIDCQIIKDSIQNGLDNLRENFQR
jgi:hypothetical protein